MATIEEFRQLVQDQTRAELERRFPRSPFMWNEGVRACPGPKYTKVDVGTSGKYMVENATGIIYGIKGYGRVHKGHVSGTLDTVDAWYWGGYAAVPREA